MPLGGQRPSSLCPWKHNGFLSPVGIMGEFVGKDKVTMELDMSEALEPLEEAPDPLYELFEGLEELVRSKRVRFSL